MWFSKGEFTALSKSRLQYYKRELNEILDSYAFTCLSPKPDSNLTWSHYANSHTRFCIEFDSAKIEAQKVTYSDNIASINLIDCLKAEELSDGVLIDKIRKALFNKLVEWKYEDEYRLFAISSLARIKKGQKFELVNYSPGFVKSVIFGYRMDDKAKKYIMGKMPEHVKFKQAYPCESKILIRTY